MKPKKKNKTIDIILSEEKFYFPGERIKGSVIVNPKTSIKVNPIIIKFSGSIFIAGKDKEVIHLFAIKKTIVVNNGNSKVLDAKQYNFPFEFVVPDNLPSVMDFKVARINYKLTAILSKPMMPESLCPKVDYPVLIVKYIDINKDTFTKPIEKQKEVITLQNGKCQAKLSVPRTGFTRGETIPVNIVVNTFKSLTQKDALVVELVRKVKIQTLRNTIEDEVVLKSNKFDLNIIGPYNFSQSITSQLLIKTTPPTIQYKDKLLKINYKIRAKLSIGSNFMIESPIVIGTWPRADIPIDDDDDDDMGEIMISDESEEEDQWQELEFKRQSMNSHKRSDSNTSRHTTDQHISTSTNPYLLTHGSNYYDKGGYLNKSSSTPDLLANNVSPPLPPIQQNRPGFIDPTIRSSHYLPPTSHRRFRSDEPILTYKNSNVPNHTLTMISSSPPHPPSPMQPQQIIIESSDDDEDDDLFTIIEKKKKLRMSMHV